MTAVELLAAVVFTVLGLIALCVVLFFGAVAVDRAISGSPEAQAALAVVVIVVIGFGLAWSGSVLWGWGG